MPNIQCPWEPKAAQRVAMNWIQCMADCYARRIIVPGPELDPETHGNVSRNMTEFFSHVLPRLHDAFDTHPLRQGTYVVTFKEADRD